MTWVASILIMGGNSRVGGLWPSVALSQGLGDRGEMVPDVSRGREFGLPQDGENVGVGRGRYVTDRIVDQPLHQGPGGAHVGQGDSGLGVVRDGVVEQLSRHYIGQELRMRTRRRGEF